MISKFIAIVITRFLPTEKWFWAAYTVSKYYAYFIGSSEERKENSYRNAHSYKLDNLMSAIRGCTQSGTVFPIPIKVTGAEFLKEKYPNGLVICSIHMPLTLLSVRLFIERGVVPSIILVKNLPKDGYLYVLGTKVKIPAVYTDPYILVKVRSILRKGGIVVILVDDISKEATYFPNIFRLAERLNSELIFTLIKLREDGSIGGHLYDLPDIGSTEEERVKEKIDTIHKHVTNIVNLK